MNKLLYLFTLTTTFFLSSCQRAPCYECEVYRESHPNSSSYKKIRTHCEYPCQCAKTPPSCQEGVPLIRDGCGCCWQCARQENDACSSTLLCDASRGLACVYESSADDKGICVVMEAQKCSVNNQSFHDGETFLLDCRTQCTCKNGTYACVSLCPGENIPPSPKCRNPHLTAVSGQCCREWMCDTRQESASPTACEPRAGVWSECTAPHCGLGVSMRWFLDTAVCRPINQARLCQLRPCNRMTRQEEEMVKEMVLGSRRHHMRRFHTCKATQRYSDPVRLTIGSCISEKRYRPKLCTSCTNKCCRVRSATTIEVAFLCPLHQVPDVLRQLQEKEQTPFWTDPDNPIDVFQIMDEGQPVLFDKASSSNSQHSPSDSQYNSKDSHHTPLSSQILDIYKGGFGILQEDFASLDEHPYLRLKNDNHEIIHQKVEWILKCHCTSCSGDKSSLT